MHSLFLTSVTELVQNYFLTSRPLYYELSVIRLILMYFSNIFCCDSIIFDGRTAKKNLVMLYNQIIFLINAQSDMQVQIVLTVAVLTSRLLISDWEKIENQWLPTPMY